VDVGDIDEQGGRMVKGFVCEREGLANIQDVRGKSGENPTVYIVK
jgi:hypothetical protein